MLNFSGVSQEQQEAIGLFLERYPLDIVGVVEVKKHDKNGWQLECGDRGQYVLTIGKPVHLFRALRFLEKKSIKAGDFISEDCSFNSLTLSVDVSQGNAVLRLETVFDLLLYMAAMGYDRLMLYSEDSYPLEGYPYFGYMRAQYSVQQLREIDNYALKLGIEVVPSIQALAHLSSVLRWESFAEIAEDDATLLVGHPGTYDFIEEQILAASRIFRSKHIHIGCDEAWNLGLGNYLFQNGYREKAAILTEHLEKVLKIVSKHSLVPIMWSDMFFRIETPHLKEEYQLPPGGQFAQQTISSVPKDVQLVYWEYIRDEASIAKRIDLHLELTDNLAIAGHIRNNRSVGSNYSLTFRATEEMMRACKSSGVQDVMATVWGDNAPESNLYGALLGMQLFAEHQYTGIPDKQSVFAAFTRCVGAKAEDFYALTHFDEIPEVHGSTGNQKAHNPSRWLFWQDPLMGLFDWNIRGLALDSHYLEQAKRMRAASKRNEQFKALFEYYEVVALALATKALLGVNLYEAYQANDLKSLDSLANQLIPQLSEIIEQVYQKHYEIWHTTYMPEGWQVFDLRYGGLLARLRTTQKKVVALLQGEVETIPELEKERLPYNGKEGFMLEIDYKAMVTANHF